MNKTRQYLIELLRSYLNGEAVELDENADYGELYSLAEGHNLAPMTFAVLKNSKNSVVIPKDVYGAFEEKFFDAVYVCNCQDIAFKKISAVLSDAKIRHIPFKGICLRELFPQRELRVMGDIDILIFPNDRESARQALNKNGIITDKPNGPVREYKIDGITLEVHTKIISDCIGGRDLGAAFADAAENAKFDGYCGTLDDEYHFAYLLAHIAHHFWFYGAGAKMIVDLAAFLNAKKIDMQKVFAITDRAELTDFSKIILTICKKWFGIGSDYGVDTAETENFLMDYGAFGNVNRNRSAVVERKQLEEGKENLKASKIRLLFPSYKKMKNLPYISFISGKPWLLPAAWAYRFFYNFKNRKSFMLDTVSGMGTRETEEQARSELEYFKRIGLL